MELFRRFVGDGSSAMEFDTREIQNRGKSFYEITLQAFLSQKIFSDGLNIHTRRPYRTFFVKEKPVLIQRLESYFAKGLT